MKLKTYDFVPVVVKNYIARHPNTLSQAEFEDILSEAYIAALEASKRYDEKTGAKFVTYASRRIEGSIKDYLRKESFLPRRTRQAVSAISAGKTIEEVAEEFGMTEKAVSQAMSYNSVSLDDENVQEIEVSCFEESLCDRMDLQSAINKLSERDKSIVVCIASGNTLKEWARQNKVSQAYATMLWKKIRTNLQNMLSC